VASGHCYRKHRTRHSWRRRSCMALALQVAQLYEYDNLSTWHTVLAALRPATKPFDEVHHLGLGERRRRARGVQVPRRSALARGDGDGRLATGAGWRDAWPKQRGLRKGLPSHRRP
jgi:hypothetical protein